MSVFGCRLSGVFVCRRRFERAYGRRVVSVVLAEREGRKAQQECGVRRSELGAENPEVGWQDVGREYLTTNCTKDTKG